VKVGQTIRRPALFEIKEQYGGFFDLLDKHIKDDEQLTKIFEQIFISLEWHSLFLKRINKDAGGNLSKNEQEREYRRFAKEVEKAISKVQAYLPIHDQIKLPEDKGTIIIIFFIIPSILTALFIIILHFSNTYFNIIYYYQ